jgi:hypothetical protein
LPIFETLINQFYTDTSRYEAKLSIMMNYIPLMNKEMANQFMKVIEQILQFDSSNSIFTKNINPLRVSLMLYRVIDTISAEF